MSLDWFTHPFVYVGQREEFVEVVGRLDGLAAYEVEGRAEELRQGRLRKLLLDLLVTQLQNQPHRMYKHGKLQFLCIRVKVMRFSLIFVAVQCEHWIRFSMNSSRCDIAFSQI